MGNGYYLSLMYLHDGKPIADNKKIVKISGIVGKLADTHGIIIKESTPAPKFCGHFYGLSKNFNGESACERVCEFIKDIQSKGIEFNYILKREKEVYKMLRELRKKHVPDIKYNNP